MKITDKYKHSLSSKAIGTSVNKFLILILLPFEYTYIHQSAKKNLLIISGIIYALTWSRANYCCWIGSSTGDSNRISRTIVEI